MTSEKLDLKVPFPPSVNTYWGFQGSHRFLTKKAVAFKSSVFAAFRDSGHAGFGKSRLKVCIQLSAPDRRTRDIDNYAKSLIDAMCQAGIFFDDEQIDHLEIVRNQPSAGGKTLVRIEPLTCQQGITTA